MGQWAHALVAGFTIPFVLFLLIGFGPYDPAADGTGFSSFSNGGHQWIDGRITAFGLFIVLRLPAVFGAIGAAQGFSVWFLAYRNSQSLS